jgi:hypothetical protein
MKMVSLPPPKKKTENHDHIPKLILVSFGNWFLSLNGYQIGSWLKLETLYTTNASVIMFRGNIKNSRQQWIGMTCAIQYTVVTMCLI